MGKPFDPFAGDDDLEFQPESQPTTIAEAPKARPRPSDPNEPSWKAVVERTAVREPPKTPVHELKLSFEELADEGGDVRGAKKIGSGKLAADDFLTGMKKQDYD